MSARLHSILLGSLAGALIGLIVFFCVDCSCGTTLRYDCTVSGREHIAAWTETSVSYDEDGGVRVSTIHHPDQWHLYCAPVESGALFDVNTKAALYHTITNGQEVSVTVRKGRWTGAAYLPRIDEP